MFREKTYEYSLECPICGGKLMVYEKNNCMRIFDGNTVIECVNNKKHRFWKNAREHFGTLHLNETASQTTFYSQQTFIWNKKNERFENAIL